MSTPFNFIDWASKAVATLGGVGYIPSAPGTVGSMLVVAAIWFLPPLDLWTMVAIAGGLFFLGTATSNRVEKFWGKDPSAVVIDEGAGVMVTFIAVPDYHSLSMVLVGFVLFRIFDISKPPPVRQAERFPGGWGVMADDIVAGVYANMVLRLIIFWGLL